MAVGSRKALKLGAGVLLGAYALYLAIGNVLLNAPFAASLANRQRDRCRASRASGNSRNHRCVRAEAFGRSSALRAVRIEARGWPC